jgi:DNA-binding NtrC family response regulator
MAKKFQIAIVDDEQDMRDAIAQWLDLAGYETQVFSGAEAALSAIGADFAGIVISDIRMPGMDGMQFLRRLMGLDSALPVIMITGHGDVPMAVEAMRLGAFDFIEKPFDPERLSEVTRKAMAARRLTLDNRALRRELASGDAMTQRLLGTSQVMVDLRQQIIDIAQSEGHVLIEGETGTGKTLAAHAIHAASGRAQKPFILVACNALEEGQLLRRLFGPVDAGDGFIPAFEQARDGTLVLEGVETLGAQAQARLLQMLEDAAPDAPRIIGICNGMATGTPCRAQLRQDLYYRLQGFGLTLAPLRARGRDAITLFDHFAKHFAEEYGVDYAALTAEDTAQLLRAPWPGNLRQLIHLAERAVLQSGAGGASLTQLLMRDHDDLMQGPVTTEGKALKSHVEEFERMLIDASMRRHKGAMTAVMEELSLPRRTLNEKMTKYGLQRADYL